MLESLAALFLMSSLFVVFLWLVALLENAIVVRHILYQSLICTQLYPHPDNCQAEADSRIRLALVGSHLIQTSLLTTATKVTGSVKLKTPWGKDWILTETLALPLQVRDLP